MIPFAEGKQYEYYCTESHILPYVARKGMYEEYWKHNAFSMIWSRSPFTVSVDTRCMVNKLVDKVKELLYPHRYEIGNFTYYYQMDWDGRVRETFFWIHDKTKLPNVKKYIRLFEELDSYVLEHIRFEIVPYDKFYTEEKAAEYRCEYDRMDLKGWGYAWEGSRWFE